MGGHDEKLKNFGKSKKKIGDLYESDNFKQKCFFEKKILNESENIFWSIDQI